MILQIETATPSCSVALAKGGEVIVSKSLYGRNVHAEFITLFIDELLNSAKISYNELDAIAVSCGPGSYTGLRIGVSTAKGLCYALDKPLIAIETLEAMARGVARNSEQVEGYDLLCPMIDARRMEVYTGVFTTKGERIRPTSAEIITASSFQDLLAHKRMLFFGDGSDKCKDILGGQPNSGFLPAFVNSAEHLSRSAYQKFIDSDFEDVAYFEPYYLKDFIAGKKA